jgi:Zn-finger nucleic acid-binding protein
MNCPKCNVEMTKHLEEEVETDECPKCGGIWVDKVDEKKALMMNPEFFTVDDIYNFRKMYEPVGKVEPIKYYKCPRCNDMMMRKNYKSHSGIIVDKCLKCGIFFDKGELEKAREFIKLGGVEFEKFQYHHKATVNSHSKLLKKINDVECTMWNLHWLGRFLSRMGY